MSGFWEDDVEAKPKDTFWEDDVPQESVSVTFTPPTSTDEELRADLEKKRTEEAAIYKPGWFETLQTQGVTGVAKELYKGAAEGAAGIPGRLKEFATSIPQLSKQFFEHPLDTANQVAEGLITGVTEPLMSPRTTGKMASELTADILLGETAVRGIPAGARAIKQGAPKIAEQTTSRLINSIIKPPVNAYRFGRNPGPVVAKHVPVANTEEGLLRNIIDTKNQFNSMVEEEIAKPENAAKAARIDPALKVVDDAISAAARSGEQALYDRLNQLKNQMTRTFEDVEGKLVPTGTRPTNLTPGQVNALKREIGADTKWTGQAFDADLNQARVGVYAQLNQILEDMVPGTKVNNNIVANLITAEKAMQRAIEVGQRKNVISLGTAIGGGLGEMAGHLVGAGPGMGAAAGVVTRELLGSTAFKTRAAKILNALTPEQRKVFTRNWTMGEDPIIGAATSTKATPPIKPRSGPPSPVTEFAPTGEIGGYVPARKPMGAATEGQLEPLPKTEPVLGPKSPFATEGELDIKLSKAGEMSASDLPKSTIDLVRKRGGIYSKERKKLVVPRDKMTEIESDLGIGQTNGFHLSDSPNDKRLKSDSRLALRNLYDDWGIPYSQKGLEVVTIDLLPSDIGIGPDMRIKEVANTFRSTSRHEGTHAAFREAIKPTRWFEYDEFTKRYGKDAIYDTAEQNKSWYPLVDKPEEVMADLVSGRADLVGLTRLEGLQLLTDMVDYITLKYGEKAAETVLRRLAPTMKGTPRQFDALLGRRKLSKGVRPTAKSLEARSSEFGARKMGTGESFRMKRQKVYRGGISETSQMAPKGTSFVARKKEAAVQYGDVQEYNLNGKKLKTLTLDLSNKDARNLIYKRLTKDERVTVDSTPSGLIDNKEIFDEVSAELFMMPDNQFIKDLKTLGYNSAQLDPEHDLFLLGKPTSFR